MKNIWLPAFAIASLINLIGVALANKNLVFITKPLLMPLLAVWLAMETHRQPPRFLKKMVLAGLAFATLGDVLLLYGEQPLFFMLGLAAFLLTHLSYITGFASVRQFDKGFLRRQPMWLLPFAAFALGLLVWLWPGIPAGMKLPVSIYAVVITVMALSVVNLKEGISTGTHRMMTTGAVLFMLSDSLIAVSRFGGHIPSPGILIMATYIIGQFLIVKGVWEVLKQ
ncbi:MAG: lysoplasmalogenase [Haliscomenobacteraceae bacterium CHB4]|nr:lysoplasmalogenase [Haliscomenobacteraceae bacterium CHB4]